MIDNMDNCSHREVAVFDLDGTLVKGSTFTLFVEWLVRRLFCMKPLVAFRIAGIVLARKFRFVSHARAKRMIMLHMPGVADDNLFREFAHKVSGIVIPEMKDLIETQRREGRFLLLATAAPEEYAVLLAGELGFDAAVATAQCGGGDECVECRGNEKLRRVKEICRRIGGEIAMVATDHEDDLPLLNQPGVEKILVHW